MPTKPRPAKIEEPTEKAVPHLSREELLAWRGLLETEARLIPLLDQELRDHGGMSVNEFDVLYQLWIAPQARGRMKDLAAAVLVTAGGVTRLVTRLEKRGWVRRVGKSGVQAVEAALTPAGQRALTRAMNTHFAGVRRVFVSHLSSAEIQSLAGLWKRLRGAR
jgi:DNA-binding MarR family transcriptional regulator